MGGHAGGEVASQIAVDTLRERFADRRRPHDRVARPGHPRCQQRRATTAPWTTRPARHGHHPHRRGARATDDGQRAPRRRQRGRLPHLRRAGRRAPADHPGPHLRRGAGGRRADHRRRGPLPSAAQHRHPRPRHRPGRAGRRVGGAAGRRRPLPALLRRALQRDRRRPDQRRAHRHRRPARGRRGPGGPGQRRRRAGQHHRRRGRRRRRTESRPTPGDATAAVAAVIGGDSGPVPVPTDVWRHRWDGLTGRHATRRRVAGRRAATHPAHRGASADQPARAAGQRAQNPPGHVAVGAVRAGHRGHRRHRPRRHHVLRPHRLLRRLQRRPGRGVQGPAGWRPVGEADGRGHVHAEPRRPVAGLATEPRSHDQLHVTRRRRRLVRHARVEPGRRSGAGHHDDDHDATTTTRRGGGPATPATVATTAVSGP